MKKRLILGLFVFTFIFLFLATQIVSARILISQPENVYNIGDMLDIDVTLNSASPVNDFLTIGLECGNSSVEIYRNPFDLQAGEEVVVEVIAKLSRPLIGPLTGECYLIAKYGGGEALSQNFEISDEITIELNMEGNRYNPGVKVNLRGIAIKKSGELVNGFVEVHVNSLGISIAKVVSEGEFYFNFTLPEDSLAGTHPMSVMVYEEEPSGEIGNQGVINETIEISQVLTSLEITVSSQNVFPENEFSYTISAYDQAGDLIEREVGTTIYEPGSFVFLEEVVNSGEENSFELGFDLTPGYWKIEVKAEDLTARKLFYIEEVRKIHSSLINDTLVVSNAGNVHYKGHIEVAIGSSVQVKQLDLDIGETKKFKLSAPEGTYLIGINDGREEVKLGSVPLTGGVVSVKAIGEGGIIGSVSQPVLWFLGVIVLILVIIYIQIRKTKFKKESGDTGRRQNALSEQKVNEQKVKKTDSVMYGKKEQASIIALKLTGRTKSASWKTGIEKALTAAKDSGARVYTDGDYRMIVFSPTLTRTKSNEVIAVKVAKRIEEILNEHNRKFRDRIDFGIGVNRGEIISEVRDEQFRFTSTGSLLARTKGIAQMMNREVLLSDSVRRTTMSEIKAEKLKDKDLWKIVEIKDRGKHSDFLKRFGHRDKK